MSELPEWAVGMIVARAGRGITDGDREQIVRGVVEAASFAFDRIYNDAVVVIADAGLPHVLMRPSIHLDGDQWIALYGENLQDGVAGFGPSPALAMADFDKGWLARRVVGEKGESHE